MFSDRPTILIGHCCLWYSPPYIHHIAGFVACVHWSSINVWRFSTQVNARRGSSKVKIKRRSRKKGRSKHLQQRICTPSFHVSRLRRRHYPSFLINEFLVFSGKDFNKWRSMCYILETNILRVSRCVPNLRTDFSVTSRSIGQSISMACKQLWLKSAGKTGSLEILHFEQVKQKLCLPGVHNVLDNAFTLSMILTMQCY